MGYDVTALLMHSDDVAESVKAELYSAQRGPEAEREAHLRAAARELVKSAPVDCGDARELVGLPAGTCS